MRKWVYSSLGHYGTVTTTVDGDDIELEPDTALYVASEADAELDMMNLAVGYFHEENDRFITRIAELEKQLLARGGHNSDCPVSWKGECYCGWEEMKKSLMER